jgi:hypothetical protein
MAYAKRRKKETPKSVESCWLRAEGMTAVEG